MDIAYIGEHALIGHIGHVATALSFVGALLATLSFFLATRNDDIKWRSLGRLAFRLHSVGVISIIVAMFIMLLNHWFEYDYVWKHSNTEMPLRYILSCFWEGQEGSFLLWTFWHVVLGNILIWKAKEWEAPVLTVVSIVQVFLASMLLGVYVFGLKLGSDPFILIRELPENIGLPWTNLPNYLERIPQFQDGRGLNPLLQNYWMTIHPPTVMFGFAATLVPFAYAIAGLWKGKMREWMAPALPWTFFGIMILGTGILMGGAWAYEALSFGGFWAWDPVENASLVPWLTMVGAGHLMMINKRKSTSLFSAFLLTTITFILVLYSTFLTRSGVLGDSSVHSFTGDGMLGQLLFYMLFFVALAVFMLLRGTKQDKFYLLISVLLFIVGISLEIEVEAIVLFIVVSSIMLVIAYRKNFNEMDAEEALWSREFWMFIGALVLLLSSMQISFSTSIPVFNLLLEPFSGAFTKLNEMTGWGIFADLAQAKFAPPGKAIAHYNKWQIPFAFIVSLLVAVGQYFRYKDTPMKVLRNKIMWALLISVVITALITWAFSYSVKEANYVALLFATVFAAVANLNYLWKGVKGKFAHAGPSVAHTGFALVLLGALLSTSRQHQISQNAAGMDLRFLSNDFSNSSDVLLYKGDTVLMGDHFVTYTGKRKEGVNLFFDVDYLQSAQSRYKKGDNVRVRESVFKAIDDHVASTGFLIDQPAHWTAVPNPSPDMDRYPQWRSNQSGDKAFSLEPFVQINPRFGNVAEPSTEHWLHKDLYTHIRYADLETDSVQEDDGFMPARVYEKQIRDTIITPTSVIVLDSMKMVRDSMVTATLGPDYAAYLVYLRIRDLYDANRKFTARPLAIYKGAERVAGQDVEVPELRVKYGLDKVEGNKVSINVYEEEFIVMQAIMFPAINILWIGCILMALGTGMAVWNRVRGMRSEKVKKRKS